MAVFTKGDLIYKDYSWNALSGDNKNIIGFPDNILLNRKEGYEVLYFINRFIDGQISWSDQTDSQKKQLGVKIERLIHDYLPGAIRSHKNVHEWIVANWSKIN